MSTIIKPTPGRVVWYWPSQQEIDAKSLTYFDQTQPLAATVAYAWPGSPLVNLSVTDQAGAQFRRTSVRLIQDGEDHPHTSEQPFAEWMPYQKGQAAKAASEPSTGEIVTSDGGKDDGTRVSGSVGAGPAASDAAPLPDQAPADQAAATKPATKGKGKAKA